VVHLVPRAGPQVLDEARDITDPAAARRHRDITDSMQPETSLIPQRAVAEPSLIRRHN
jgi:hypothetical protein